MITIELVTPESQAKEVARDASVVIDVTSDDNITSIEMYLNDTPVLFTTSVIPDGFRITYDPGGVIWRHRETISLFVHARDDANNYTELSDEFSTIDHDESLYKLAQEDGWSWDRLRLIPESHMTVPATKRMNDIDLTSAIPDFLTSGGVNSIFDLSTSDFREFGSPTEPRWIASVSHGWAHMLGFRKFYMYSESVMALVFDPCTDYTGVIDIELENVPKDQVPIFIGYFSRVFGQFAIHKELKRVRSFTTTGTALSSKCVYDIGFCSALDDSLGVDTRKYYTTNCRSETCPLQKIDTLERTIVWSDVSMGGDEFIYDQEQNKLIFNGPLDCENINEVIGYSIGSGSQKLTTTYFPISSDAIIMVNGMDVTDQCTIDYASGEVVLNTSYYITGLSEISARYHPLYMVLYEPENTVDNMVSPNIHPIHTGAERGFVCVADWDMNPYALRIDVDRDEHTETVTGDLSHEIKVYGPVYVGGDYVSIDVRVEGRMSTHLCPHTKLRIGAYGHKGVGESGDYLGRINGKVLGGKMITVKASSSGIAHLIYQPPRSPQAVGVTIKNDPLYVGADYIELPEAIPYEDIVNDEGNYIVYTFGIRADDHLLGMYYATEADKAAARLRGETVWEEWGTEGAVTYGCNGRRELLVEMSGGTTSVMDPSELRQSDGITVATAGDMVKYIYYPANLPTDCIAFYINIPKTIVITVSTENNVPYAAFGLNIQLPQHMTGEFMLGGIDYVGAKSFDGVSYFTLNPYAQALSVTKFDTRAVSTVFSVIETDSNLARTRFSVLRRYPDSVRDLYGTTQNQYYPFGLRAMLDVITMLESRVRTKFSVVPNTRDALRTMFTVVHVNTVETNVTADLVAELMTSTTLEFDTLIPRESQPREMN